MWVEPWYCFTVLDSHIRSDKRVSLLPQDDEDVGVAPPRATFSAPSDLLNDIPPNDQVRGYDNDHEVSSIPIPKFLINSNPKFS